MGKGRGRKISLELGTVFLKEWDLGKDLLTFGKDFKRENEMEERKEKKTNKGQ